MKAVAIKHKKSYTVQEKKAGEFTIAFVIFLLLVFLAPVFITNTPIHAEGTDDASTEEEEEVEEGGYSSWIQSDPTLSDSLYAGTTDVGYDEIGSTPADWDFSSISWITNALSALLMFIGWIFDALLSGGWGVMSEVNLSTDAIIFGRLKEGVNTNWVYFELVPNNIYGILGTQYYRSFCNVIYSVFLIMFLYCLFRQIGAGSDSRRKAEFKEMLQYSALMFLFLYLFPHMVDICIYLKDWLLLRVYNLFGKPDEQGIGGLARTWANLWWNGYGDKGFSAGSMNWWYAILYLGTVFAGLFFVIDYVKTALKQTMLFSLSPVFFVLSIKNRRLLSNLVVEVFPNIFIPVFDAMLLMIPIGVARIAVSIGVSDSSGIPDTLGLIILIMIWSIIPMRREILRLFGASSMLGGNRGLGGIMAAAMMGLRMFGGGRFGGAGAGSGIGFAAEGADANAALGKMYGEMSDALHSGEVGASMLRNGAAGLENVAEDAAGTVANELGDSIAGAGEMSPEDIVAGAQEGISGSGMNMEDIDGSIPSGDEIPYTPDDASMDDVANIHPDMSDDDLIATRGANLDELTRMEEADAELMGRAATLKNEIGALESANQYDNGLLKEYDSLSSRGMELGRKLSSDDLDFETRTSYSKESRSVGARLKDVSNQLEQSREVLAEQVPGMSFSPTNNKVADVRAGVSERSKLIAEKQAELRRVNAEIMQNNQGIKNAKSMESYYAKSSKHTGASGETYGSSAEYKKAQQMRDIKMKYANYKNFESNHFRDVLTPEDKMRFYTERATRQRVAQGIKAASVVAGVGVGGVAAVASLYGGPSAMATAGILSGMGTAGATNSVGNRVANSMSMTPRASGNRPVSKPVKTTPVKTSNGVSESVRSLERNQRIGKQYADKSKK